ncbi:hypothetical protein [Capnocytophaga leadbetteri]
MARTKKRNIDVLSVKMTFREGEQNVSFRDVLNYMNGKEFRCNEKIFNLSLLDTNRENCILGLIETTQDSDIPPKRNKRTGVYSSVQIDTRQEGFAYANIFLYDYERNVFLYEINRNGCFPNQLKKFIISCWKEDENNILFDLNFPAVVRADEYERMLQMNWYKKIKIELFNPVELQNSITEDSDSIYNNIVQQQIRAGVQTNANTIIIEQIAQKRINIAGLSRSMIMGLTDYVKRFLGNGFRQNVQTLEIQGYTYDSEDDSNKCKTINIIADSFDEYFRITEIQIHNDVQQRERKEGIEGLYDKLLPEIRRLIGF